MITGENESKILTKHISCKCKCRFDRKKIIIKITGGITIKSDVSVKNIIYMKKIVFGNLVYVVTKMENTQKVLWMIQRLRVIKL